MQFETLVRGTCLERFLHELHGIILAHVRLVLLPEQWPRQHVAVACHHSSSRLASCSTVFIELFTHLLVVARGDSFKQAKKSQGRKGP